jgi:hypothetical protein
MRLLAGLLLITSAVAGPGDPSAVVAGLESSPVYIEPSQRSLVPDEEADRLAERVAGHDPAIHIAVVPAAALGTSGSREQAARAYVDQVVDLRKQDGIYLVVFGGAITWGSAVGVDVPIAEILTEELGKHSRSDPVGTLDGVLDQLDVPASPGSGAPGWLWPAARQGRRPRAVPPVVRGAAGRGGHVGGAAGVGAGGRDAVR